MTQEVFSRNDYYFIGQLARHRLYSYARKNTLMFGERYPNAKLATLKPLHDDVTNYVLGGTNEHFLVRKFPQILKCKIGHS